jgi:hypothetical protein
MRELEARLSSGPLPVLFVLYCLFFTFRNAYHLGILRPHDYGESQQRWRLFQMELDRET